MERPTIITAEQVGNGCVCCDAGDEDNAGCEHKMSGGATGRLVRNSAGTVLLFVMVGSRSLNLP